MASKGLLAAAASKAIPALPLCERPAKYSTTLGELIAWRCSAREEISSLGSKLLDADGGPSAEELTTELDWYLEDAVSCWSSIKSSLRGGEVKNRSTRIRLRKPIEELDRGWQERIHQRRPFQYLVGCSHWRDLVLSVQEGVLVPRPETEQLVDLAADAMLRYESLAAGVWADLGTGSGAIAIGIARLLMSNGASGRVVAVDSSQVALAVAELNVRRCQVEELVDVVKGSWLCPFEDNPGKLAGIVSNPPYIPSKNMTTLQAEVGKHEPWSALDGGQEGMDDLEVICDGAPLALCSGGFLALETNGGKQAEAVAERLTLGRAFDNVAIVKDLADIDRFVTAYRR